MKLGIIHRPEKRLEGYFLRSYAAACFLYLYAKTDAQVITHLCRAKAATAMKKAAAGNGAGYGGSCAGSYSCSSFRVTVLYSNQKRSDSYFFTFIFALRISGRMAVLRRTLQ